MKFVLKTGKTAVIYIIDQLYGYLKGVCGIWLVLICCDHCYCPCFSVYVHSVSVSICVTSTCLGVCRWKL